MLKGAVAMIAAVFKIFNDNGKEGLLCNDIDLLSNST
jgi:hypothetical protein